MVYQLVNNGDVPDEDYFNNALMKQAVIVCTSGTRPSSPPTGMRIFETDTRMDRYYNGTAWRAAVGALPHCMLVKTSATISNNSVVTIQWTSATRNRHSMWSAGSSDLVTIPYDGLYDVVLSVRWASQAVAVGLRACYIYVGGVEQNVSYLPMTSSFNATGAIVQLQHPMALTAGEQIQARVYQNSGGSLDITAPTRLLVRMVDEGSEAT